LIQVSVSLVHHLRSSGGPIDAAINGSEFFEVWPGKVWTAHSFYQEYLEDVPNPTVFTKLAAVLITGSYPEHVSVCLTGHCTEFSSVTEIILEFGSYGLRMHRIKADVARWKTKTPYNFSMTRQTFFFC
jgi:hypothetical protein